MNRNHRLHRICLGVAIALLVFLGISFHHHRQEENRRAERILAVIEEAMPYEQEMREIENELKLAAEALSYQRETARFMIGYEPSAIEDFSYIQEQSVAYGFSPVLVLDCTEDLGTLLSYLDEAMDRGWEIMLTGSSFSDEVNETVREVRTSLRERELADTDIFLLRNSYENEKNKQMLQGDGFTGYAIYADAPSDGWTEEGLFYFDYGYIREAGTNIGSRMSSIYSGKVASIIVFEMEARNDGSLPESEIVEILNATQQYTAYEDCEYASVAETVGELSSARDAEAVRRSTYDAYAKRQREKMKELNEQIEAIYAEGSEAG